MLRRPINRRYVLMGRWVGPSVLVAIVLTYAVVRAGKQPDAAAPNANGTISGLTNILERQVSQEMARFQFEEVATEAGITVRHFPDTRQSLLPEDMGSGLAWGDYDDDGDDDLFIVNFCGSILPDATPGGAAGKCTLYHNDGNGTFVDVSDEAGLSIAIFGLAAAWADYDNDDDLDLYLTCYGPNHLYRNQGNGTFTDVSHAAGVDDPAFGAGCTWCDYDRDGWIDLYVCNYVEFEYRPSDRSRTALQYDSEIPYTINPSAYHPQANRLYRNNHDGTFTNVAEAAGVANPSGRSLSAAWFDFNDDGWIDLYVANDVSENGVFLNRGDGTFADIGAISLAADYRGAMGLATGDFDHDSDLDLLVTHWIAQENALFENMTAQRWLDQDGKPRIFFMDSAEMHGLGYISLRMSGWATGFVDLDNDGWLDLWIVNGNTFEDERDHTRLRPQTLQLFWHKPGRGFFEVASMACPDLRAPIVGRGGAHSDYDLDGRIDLAVLAHGAQPWLLHNTTTNPNHWLRLRLRQVGGNTRAIGARIAVRTGEMVQTAQVAADGPYLSMSQIEPHFGLGSARVVDEIVIHWPDGAVETLFDVPADQVLALTHEAKYPVNR